MENLIENAVLLCGNKYVEMGDVETDLFMLLSVSVKKAMISGKWELSRAKELFEKMLIETLIAGSKGDLDRISSMLDIPKTNLAERIKRLGVRSQS
jgi:DNA-binding NtrC family response regulator